jgi:hypothetical protein
VDSDTDRDGTVLNRCTTTASRRASETTMGKDAAAAAVNESSMETPTKKRRFPLPFRKKHLKDDQDNSHKNKIKDAPLNGSGKLVNATTGAAAASDAANNSKSPPLKVTIVEPPKSSSANPTTITSSKSQQQQQRHGRRQTTPPPKMPWLARTKFFQRMCDWAFTVVDQDGSGNVDEKELYSGLLLIHLKLGSYAGPAACKVR